MSNNIKTETAENIQLCEWCGIPLGSANTIRDAVCLRCYKLLIGANLSQEEIFSPKPENNESLPLPEKEAENDSTKT